MTKFLIIDNTDLNPFANPKITEGLNINTA
jgi:hypothetical protein